MKKVYLLLLIVIIVAATALRFYRLSNLMVFIGDQGWFYLAARDFLLRGKIPLVGVASSHPWLHQGPFWTYIVALIFIVFHFNPLAPGYFTALLGVLLVWLVYKIGSVVFSQRIGLIASFFYATSALVVLTDRMPYHTSLIPLFSLLFFYCLVRWTRGNKYYFPTVILCLTILYNFELATASLWFIFFLTLGYGFFRKKTWITELTNKYVLFLSFFSFVIPMLPMFVYDFSHGFPQTFGFLLWTGYRVARIFGYPAAHPEIPSASGGEFLQFSLQEVQKVIFVQNGTVALGIFVFGLIIFVSILFRKNVSLYNSSSHSFKYHSATILKGDEAVLLALWFFVPFFAYLVGRIPSGAYLPMLFPSFMLILAVGFDYFLQKKLLTIPILFIIGIIGITNSYSLISQDYFTSTGATFSRRVIVAREIVKDANGISYNLIGKGNGSQFASFTMNTVYLTWWLGNGPKQKKQKLQFVIIEDWRGIKLLKKYD